MTLIASLAYAHTLRPKHRQRTCDEQTRVFMRCSGMNLVYPYGERSPAAQGLPLPAAQGGDPPRQPGLGAGHDLHPDGPGLRLSHGRGGCGQPHGAGPQGGDHAGGLSRP